MKKIIITLISLIIFGTSTVLAADNNMLLNTQKRSDNIRIYTNNVKSFHGCSERLGRKNNKEAYLVYELDGAKSVKATAYSDSLIDETSIAFYVSADGDSYEPVKMYREFNENGNVGHPEYALIAKDFPEDARYFKIHFPETEKFSYLPQIGSIELSKENIEATGLLFEDEFENSSKMYDITSNFRFENSGNANQFEGDKSRCLRMYDLDSAVKYKIKDPINLYLRYGIMDDKGEIEVYASSKDGDYKLVPSKKTLPIHSHNNWSMVDLTIDSFPEGTEYIMIKMLANGKAPWPPTLMRLEVYY